MTVFAAIPGLFGDNLRIVSGTISGPETSAIKPIVRGAGVRCAVPGH
jgi:hypothetical protein